MEDPLEYLEKAKIVDDGVTRALIIESNKEAPPLEPKRPAWLDSWEPRPVDVEFFRRLLLNLKDGAIWRLPATKAEYKIDHRNRMLILIVGPVDQWFWQNVKTLAKLGYKVIVKKTLDTGFGKSNPSISFN